MKGEGSARQSRAPLTLASDCALKSIPRACQASPGPRFKSRGSESPRNDLTTPDLTKQRLSYTCWHKLSSFAGLTGFLVVEKKTLKKIKDKSLIQLCCFMISRSKEKTQKRERRKINQPGASVSGHVYS